VRFCSGCGRMSTMAVVAEMVEVLDLPGGHGRGRLVARLRCPCGLEVEEIWGRAPVDSSSNPAV